MLLTSSWFNNVIISRNIHANKCYINSNFRNYHEDGYRIYLRSNNSYACDVIDYNEVKFGTRNESIIASFQTLLVKGASAVSAWLIGAGLTIVGYEANIVQSAATIFGMRVLMIGVPSVISIIAFIIYKKGYKIEGQFQDEIISKLEEKEVLK